MNRTKLAFLGAGSAFNYKLGNNCAYYRENDSILFIDFGETAFTRARELNLFEGVKNVFFAITHLHGDHVGSLSTCLFYCKYILNIECVILCGEEEKQQCLRDFLRMQGVADEGIYRFADLGGAFKNIVSYEFKKVYHVKTMNSYALQLDFADGSKVYFSGDTCDEKYIKSVVENLKEGDEFYCDTCDADYEGSAHTSVTVLERRVPIEKRKSVICMHFDNENVISKALNLGFHVAIPIEEKA